MPNPSSVTPTRFAPPSEEERSTAKALLMRFQFPWLVACGDWALRTEHVSERELNLYTLNA